ncbi:hypothetical protein Hdeb2414_s0023g00638841 [Helianthus debilis subsp. tardiflorus]
MPRKFKLAETCLLRLLSVLRSLRSYLGALRSTESVRDQLGM